MREIKAATEGHPHRAVSDSNDNGGVAILEALAERGASRRCRCSPRSMIVHARGARAKAGVASSSQRSLGGKSRRVH